MSERMSQTGESVKQLVLVLIGSPRGIEKSSSARLAKEVLRAFSSDEWERPQVGTFPVCGVGPPRWGL